MTPPIPHLPPLLFTPQEVADTLHLHPETILRFIREKKIRAIKIGRQYRIPQQAIDAYLDQNS